jgi:ent-copalyl diphosphate synthase
MMQKTNNEDNEYNKSSGIETRCMVHDRQTYLLLVQIIEICAGRICDDVSMVNNKDGDQFNQLACATCDLLNHRMLLSQVNTTLQ